MKTIYENKINLEKKNVPITITNEWEQKNMKRICICFFYLFSRERRTEKKLSLLIKYNDNIDEWRETIRTVYHSQKK